MIFPGMDPYLEGPRLWPGVHHRLISNIADPLQARLGRRYVAAIEERVYLERPGREVVPDVSIRLPPPATHARAGTSRWRRGRVGGGGDRRACLASCARA